MALPTKGQLRKSKPGTRTPSASAAPTRIPQIEITPSSPIKQADDDVDPLHPRLRPTTSNITPHTPATPQISPSYDQTGKTPPAPPPSLCSSYRGGKANDSRIAVQEVPSKGLRFDVKARDIPRVKGLALPKIYPLLSRLLGAPDYGQNMASFWVLDIIAEALLVAQGDNMSRRNQKIMLAWFGHVFSQLQEHRWTREQLFEDLRYTVEAAAVAMAHSGWDLLPPKEVSKFVIRPNVKKLSSELYEAVQSYVIHEMSQESDVTIYRTLRSAGNIVPSTSTNRLVPSAARPPSPSMRTPIKTPSKSTPPPPPTPTTTTTTKTRSRNASRASVARTSVAKAAASKGTGVERSAQPSALVKKLVFDWQVTVHDLITIVRLLYNAFASGFSYALISSALCAPQPVIDIRLPYTIQTMKKLKPLPPPPRPPTPPTPPPAPEMPAKKGKGKEKGEKTKKGNKEEKEDKTGKEKSDKKAKGKSDKVSKKESTGKLEKDGKKGSKGAVTKDSKKDPKAKGVKGKPDMGENTGEKANEVTEDSPVDVLPLNEMQLKYLPPPVDWNMLATIAHNNKYCINRLYEACPPKFFDDMFPVKVAVDLETVEPEPVSVDKKDKTNNKDKKDDKKNKDSKKEKKGDDKADKKGKKGAADAKGAKKKK